MPGTDRIGQRTRQAYIERGNDPFYWTLMDADIVQRERVRHQLEEGNAASADIDEEESKIRSNDREGDPWEAGT
jgi:hypothetical protein